MEWDAFWWQDSGFLPREKDQHFFTSYPAGSGLLDVQRSGWEVLDRVVMDIFHRDQRIRKKSRSIIGLHPSTRITDTGTPQVMVLQHTQGTLLNRQARLRQPGPRTGESLDLLLYGAMLLCSIYIFCKDARV